MPHPSPAQHNPKTTSYATVWSITHHTKGANLPWFLRQTQPLGCCLPSADQPQRSCICEAHALKLPGTLLRDGNNASLIMASNIYIITDTIRITFCLESFHVLQ